MTDAFTLPPGPIVPLVTPFDDSGETIDEAALRALVEHVLASGAVGVLSTALTGEGPLLSAQETERVWETTIDAVAGRVPVLGTVITTRTTTAIDLARRGSHLGLSALMPAAILPELYARRAVADLVGFHAAIAEATGLAQVLFNYPSLTGADLTPDVIERLVAVPDIVAVKESSGDSRRVHALQRRFGERIAVICGSPDTALESLALGCRTWITGIMNVVAGDAGDLMATMARADLPAARHIYSERILPIVDIMRSSRNPTGTIKAGLRLQGYRTGPPRSPGRPLSGPPLAALQAFLARSVAR
jgi:4-hydroxy-tetrahydrodipicolinate synthase